MPTSRIEVAGVSVSPQHYINGQRVASNETFELYSPIDQAFLGNISEGLDEHVEAAVQSAAAAFPAWAALGPAGRKPYLDRFAEKIGKRADEFCRLEST